MATRWLSRLCCVVTSFMLIHPILVFTMSRTLDEVEEISFDDQDGGCFIDDATRDKVIAACMLLSMHDEDHASKQSRDSVNRKLLGAYLKTVFQTAGRAERCPQELPLPKQLPQKSKVQNQIRKRPTITISPKVAHKRWQRVKKLSIFSWPLTAKSFRISSFFGPRTLKGCKGFHKGIDMAALAGTPVRAALAGKVTEARYSPGYGNYILIRHDGQYKTRYAHLQKILVKAGQYVKEGTVIGKVGATGKVAKSKGGTSASHLHFEVYSQGRPIDPFFVLA